MFENLPSIINATNSKTEVKLFADYMKAGIFQEVFGLIFNTIFNFFTDAREDARHIISNSKDQSIKLWDLRKFANNQCISLTKDAIRHRGWDYRWGSGQCPGKGY